MSIEAQYLVECYEYQTLMQSDTFPTRSEASHYAREWTKADPVSHAAHISMVQDDDGVPGCDYTCDKYGSIRR